MMRCKDCLPAQAGEPEINHSVAYVSVLLNYIDRPFLEFLERLFNNSSKRFYDKYSLVFLKIFAFLRIGRFIEYPDNKVSPTIKCFWEEALKRGIRMREFRMGPFSEIFVADYKGRSIVWSGLPRPSFQESPAVSFMHNKGVLKRKLKAAGLPVPEGGLAWSVWSAEKIFDRINKPAVIKPHIGSHHRHTTTGLYTEEDLISGFKNANRLSPFVVVEEELPGQLYRSTIIDGKIAGVVMRQKNFGDPIEEVSGRIHHENREMLENVARLLNDPLIGVDFVIEDIGRSWKDNQKAGVISCTHLPAIDLHHYVPNGTPQNVAGALWDYVLPESRNNWIIR